VCLCMCDHRNPERGPMFQLETYRKNDEVYCFILTHFSVRSAIVNSIDHVLLELRLISRCFIIGQFI
jgi:hypothetical protein